MRDIGKNIKDLREQQKLTQEELAEKLFVTRQTVSNYENGKTRPDVDMILKMAEVLGTDANTVFYGPPIPPDRKAALRKFTIGAVWFAVLGIACLVLLPIMKALRHNTYIDAPYYFVRELLVPGVALLAGWLLLQGLSIPLQFKSLAKPWAKYARRAIWGLLGLLLFCTLALFAFYIVGDYLSATRDSVALSFDIPVLTRLCFWVSMLNMHAPAVYALFGCALWVLSPVKKTEG